MKYDNDRGRYATGYDGGTIVSGVVTLDPEKGYLVLVDEDGVAFDHQEVLCPLVGKEVRMTIVSFETLENLEKMYNEAQKKQQNS